MRIISGEFAGRNVAKDRLSVGGDHPGEESLESLAISVLQG